MSDTVVKDQDPCPCGTGLSYDACCGPYHLGAAAPTPEALMRSRFSAFNKKMSGYLMASWHPESRPTELDLSQSPHWTRLEVLDTSQILDQGTVHFKAIYRSGSAWGYLEEVATFVRQGEQWLYLSGRVSEGRLKPGRNEACPCGSGRKFKSCCQTATA